MKALVLSWVLALGHLSGSIVAQNLVPNSSFESYVTCPDSIGELDQAIGWSSLYGTPDYFNACSDTFLTDVPSNGFGYQHASEGQAYLGCCTYKAGPVYREIVQAELTGALVPGQLYSLSMSVSPAGFGIGDVFDVQFACRGIGMRLSTQPLPLGLIVDNQAVLYMDATLSDTSLWVTISTTLIPDSAYQFVQLGNFFDDQWSQPMPLDSAGANEAAYAFVDAVCIALGSEACLLGQQVSDPRPDAGLVLNVTFGDALSLNSDAVRGSMISATIVDPAGRLFWREDLSGGSGIHTIHTAHWPQGMYLLRLSGVSLGNKSFKLFHVSP